MIRHRMVAIATREEAQHLAPLTDQPPSLPNTQPRLRTNHPAYQYSTLIEIIPKKNLQSLRSQTNTPIITNLTNLPLNMRRKITLSSPFPQSPLPEVETPAQYQRLLNTALHELPGT